MTAESAQAAEWRVLADNCRHIAGAPPATFLQAAQLFYFLFLLNGSDSPGRLDQYLWPPLRRDLDAGRLTLDAAQEIVDCLFLKLDEFICYGATLGGQLPAGGDATNPLTWLCLHSIERLRLLSPRTALRWHAGLFSKRTGVVVDFQADQRFPRLPEGAESALFRIAQEALLNVAKHTKASRVVLRLATSAAKLSCSLADDGAGFDPEALLQPAGGNGWGLTIMRERAELIGASFLIESTPGRGTTVTVSLSEDAPCR